MEYFPICINLTNKNCLVIGGGKISLRKTKQLLKYHANVTIVSPIVLEDFKLLNVDIRLRKFLISDLDNISLVVCATDDIALNQKVLELCDSKNILCNSATNTSDNGYIFPAIAKHHDISIGVTTNGESPYISKLIKSQVEDEILSRYSDALEVSKQCRKTLLRDETNPKVREKIVKYLVDYTLLNGKPSKEKTLQIIKEFR